MKTRNRPLPRWFSMGTGPRTAVTYRQTERNETTSPLEEADDVSFENCLPVRPIPEHVGQPNTPGKYWSASSQRLVDYESFLESKWITMLDFDPNFCAMSCQPMRFDGVDIDGVWDHTPDIFALRTCDRPLLLDIKHPKIAKLDAVKLIRQHQRTRPIAAKMGWEYRFVGEPDQQLWANVRWLAGYRRPPNAGLDYIPKLLAATQLPIEIGQLCRDICDEGIARPVLFHLMWKQDITFDIHQPLRGWTPVWARNDQHPFHLNLNEMEIRSVVGSKAGTL